MAETAWGMEAATRWGPAERAAVDRCLALPALAASSMERVRPPMLCRLIETEIIPRLMLAHRADPGLEDDLATRQPDAADVAEIASLAVASDPLAALDFARTLMARGHCLDAVLLDVLAPAARLLGDLWADDMCTFADVTIGLSRLQQLLRSIGRDCESDGDALAGGRILLASTPGEQHSFGLSILESFFTRAGWDVSGAATADDLRDSVRDDWFDVVGLSLSCDASFESARMTIKALRKSSRNRSLYVMVGGRFFVDHPDRAAEVGADAVASDAQEALRMANLHSCAMLRRC